jgi:AcrR family transcriptional regulator
VGRVVPDVSKERARIRDAFVDLCFERGYAGTTLPRLLERAEVNEAAFDRHFDSLDDCFFQICRAELERYREEAAAAQAGLETWRDRLRATSYALYRFLSAEEKVRWLTVVEVRAAGEPAQQLIAEEIESLFDLIDEGRHEPTAPVSLTRATAKALGGGIFNQLYAAAGRSGPLPAEKSIVPQLMYATILPYLGPELAKEELDIPPPPTASG